MEKRLSLNQSITELLEEDDRLTMEGIASAMLSEAWGDDESYNKKGRRLLEAFQAGDVDAFCIAMTGWSFENILKKSGAIEDYDGEFPNENFRWSKEDPRLFWFMGVPYRAALPNRVLWNRMMLLNSAGVLWHSDDFFTLLSDTTADGCTELLAANQRTITRVCKDSHFGLRPVFIPLDGAYKTHSRERFSYLGDGGIAIMAPASDFAPMIPQNAEPLSPFEPVCFIKVGDVLVCNNVIAVNVSWEDIERHGHYSVLAK